MGWYNYECTACDRDFPNQHAYDQHMQAKQTFACRQCGRLFFTSNARWQPMNDTNHFPYECRCCTETWSSEAQREDHEHDAHSYYRCEDCNRGFGSANAQRMHMHSRAHRHDDACCPACGRDFGTAAGIVHHLERGTCPNAPNVNRDLVYKFMRSQDPQGAFTNRLLTWDGSTTGDQPNAKLATGRAWDGQAFVCYLCRRGFNSLHGLNQHLTSTVHAQALYRCPQMGCRREFRTLASRINHFESESCGFVSFDLVQNRIIAWGQSMVRGYSQPFGF